MDFDYNLVSEVLTGTTIPVRPHDVRAANPNFKRIPHYLSGPASIMRSGIVPDDFTLKTNSAGVDKGLADANTPAVDFYGAARTVPYDMGAFNTVKTLIRQPGFTLRSLFPFTVIMTPNPTAGRTIFTLENYGDDLLPVRVTVHAIDGRLVHERVITDATTNTLTWDGRSEQGEQCAAGYYQVRIATTQSTECKTLVVLR
jgi:hypothetical protein